MNILGISAFYHDSAAALLQNGTLIAAAQEERFSRIKHDSAFPRRAASFCLEKGGLKPSDLDLVIFYEKPFLKFERLLHTYLAYAPRGLSSFLRSMPSWMNQKLFLKGVLLKGLASLEGVRKFRREKPKLLFCEHHESHGASAFFPSPFSSAAVMTVDGVGEWATASIGRGEGNRYEILREIHFPHSLGLLYTAFTYYLGFRVNSGEYKVMGLAPYGKPRYAKLIREHLIEIHEDGSFRLNPDYFDYAIGRRMIHQRFCRLFGEPPRVPESELRQFHMDIACSIQAVTEEVMVNMAREAKRLTGSENLCLAGGVALNCVGNSKILQQGLFKGIWIQPAAGDAGGAVGAAYVGWHHYLNRPRTTASLKNDAMRGSYLGPSFKEEEIESFLMQNGIRHQKLPEEELFKTVATALSAGSIVGWFQGAMEFGPRALGNRSILGNPCLPQTQSVMNLKIKFRESFRPFAPTVLQEATSEFFDLPTASPYMLLVAPVHQKRRRQMSAESRMGLEQLKEIRSDIPAVTHVDFSARVQTLSLDQNERFYRLIRAFQVVSGYPVVVNTSFNVRGEPIVCTYEEAYRCFRKTQMDYLVLGNFLISKEA